tara:strand:- start:3274 stop:3759 length:486 start_codon:yes stop_codon:yes gene_type:complete
MAGRHCNRKETFAFTEADYTPGAYSNLILSTSMGLSGNIHRVVVDQTALDAAGGAAVGGSCDVRIVNGYYTESDLGSAVPSRDVAWAYAAITLVPSDLNSSAEINVAGTSLGALYSASQRREGRGVQGTPSLTNEKVGVSISPAVGVTGTINVTVYSNIGS